MVRRACLLVLAAALLACPAKVPKGLVPGAFVRVDSLGNPIVEVEKVADGTLYCREIPSERPRRIPLSQIHQVDPVSSALVARIRSFAHQGHGNINHRLDQIDQATTARLQGLLRQNHQFAPPNRDMMPRALGDPSMAPKSVDDVPVPTGPAPGGQ
jgi:hypothetical protein